MVLVHAMPGGAGHARDMQAGAATARLGLVAGLRVGLTSNLRNDPCSSGGWMWAEQAMPGPCRQATARLGLGFGLT